MSEAVAALEAKRAAAVQRARDLADERAAVRLHVASDPEARRRLSEINAALALHENELRNIDAAIAEAVRRADQEEQAA
jgi:hypothetical protein